jgi:UDP-glucose 4-epimerase
LALYTVTGAAGFIGSHLVDSLLAAGHRVRGLDNLSTGRLANLDARCQLLTGDVADPAMVGKALEGADGCFHLAAVASVQRGNEEWLPTHRTNQSGTVAILDGAREGGGIPVVYASSAAVYGNLGTGVAHEDTLPAPLTAYGADKLGSELHARVAFLVHGVPTLGLRFFNIYGTRQHDASSYSGVISIFLQRLKRRMPLMVYGQGDQTRDFVHVSDAVRHLIAGMDHLHHSTGSHVLNVCTGRATSILDLARLLGALDRTHPEIIHGPARAGDISQSIGDPSQAVATLEIRADTSLRDGLSTMLSSAVVAETGLQSRAVGF